MNIRIKTRAKVITGKTKQEIDNKITRQYGHVHSSVNKNSVRLSGINNDDILLVNYQKVNKKSIQTKNKDGKTIKSVKVRDSGWIANLYVINKALLNYIDVKQYVKHFTITS